MGLGKSLSMISLIAAHPAVNLDLEAVTNCGPGNHMPVKSTLLIVPFSCKIPLSLHLRRLLSAEKYICLLLTLSVLTTWDHQLNRSANILILYDERLIRSSHLKPHTLKWHIFHAKRRVNDRATLSRFDVVITTFQTVSMEWKKHMSYSSNHSNLLFSLRWHRVVLDEGE